MKLSVDSIEWAVKHLEKESDTDLFPRPLEIEVIKERSEDCKTLLSQIEVGDYKWKPARRFIIPKDELSYRLVSQLDPMDSLLLSAIIKEYGHKIEEKRIPENEQIVFGNRFSPSSNGYLYKNDGQWKKMWEAAKVKVEDYDYVVKFDIADFYNQIYHHVIENQLIECGFPNQIKKAICNLIKLITVLVSRGIPVGPHATHILAEAAMIPIDNSLKHHGIVYCRYMDDFIAFANSKLECRIILNKVADILDKQERLILQRSKTKVLIKEEFLEECNSHLSYDPLNETEEKILEIVKERSGAHYSIKIDWDDLDEEDKDFFSRLFYDDLITDYLETDGQPNYSKLRWIYRRLRQLGVPYAIDSTLDKIEDLTPIINDVCEYLIAAAPNYSGDLKDKGETIYQLINTELFKSSEFLQIALINLFTSQTEFNHFDMFSSIFNSSPENIKRKIILFAHSINATDWIREIKEKFSEFSPWNKRAALIACSLLPSDERKFFYNTVKEFYTNKDYMENLIIDWGRNK